MRELTLDEIHAAELNLLLHFSEFCKKHNLRYRLTAGTLLGAIRHKGFIPWDDDIDICMPRPDYERFLQIYDDENFLLKSSSNVANFPFAFAKLINTKIFVKRKFYSEKIEAKFGLDALWIDIFPIDGAPKNDEELKKICKKITFYHKITQIYMSKFGSGKTIFKKIAKMILKPLAIYHNPAKCVKKVEKIVQKYRYEDCEFVAMIAGAIFGICEKMKKSEFEKEFEVEFEGHKFTTFSCYEKYLRGTYGDYWQLPPEDKRITHDMKVFEI